MAVVFRLIDRSYKYKECFGTIGDWNCLKVVEDSFGGDNSDVCIVLISTNSM